MKIMSANEIIIYIQRKKQEESMESFELHICYWFSPLCVRTEFGRNTQIFEYASDDCSLTIYWRDKIKTKDA